MHEIWYCFISVRREKFNHIIIIVHDIILCCIVVSCMYTIIWYGMVVNLCSDKNRNGDVIVNISCYTIVIHYMREL